MEIPKNLLYTEEHEWLKVEGEFAIVGITDYAQKELGDIVFVDVQTVGQKLSKGESLGTIEAVKTVADVFMPVSGEVVEFNQNLSSKPELINQSPYEEGWIVKIKILDSSELANLLTAEKYEEKIK